jgi:hypothetical protein
MMRSRGTRLLAAALVTLGVSFATAPAFGAFPYSRPGANTHDFTDLYLTTQVPSDLCGDGNQFKFASSPDPANTLVNIDPVELGGVRGAHVVDGLPPTGCDQDPQVPPTVASADPTAFKLTTGRPDVTIAVLDSGIKWNDAGSMDDLRLKVHLNRGELPLPQADLATAISDPGTNDCALYDTSVYDANGDGVFNIDDYACDSRVADVLNNDTRRVGPAGVLVPQDLIIAFTDGTDADSNGYVDDIAGWDFLDNDNDPFDDVQYGHGTGEAKDSSSEADNGGQLGSCPNCMVVPLRVGDSFIADVNRFAAAVLYATDNGIDVVQEALGTLNNSRFAREAVDYAYHHGVTVIASAADEAAQHNNWPSSLPHVILVNSVRDQGVPPPRDSYLAINGCTNFNSKITLAIPSTSCSSNATGLGAGMAGLVYSAALDAKAKGALSDYPDTSQCQRANGNPCAITPNEVRQVLASGTIGGQGQADDVNFAGTPAGSGNEPSCTPPTPNCTDPNGALQTQVNVNRTPTLPASKSYPARKGPDQFYGWGRVNMQKAVSALLSDPQSPAASKVPPEAEITSPEWYAQVNPDRQNLQIRGQVFARGAQYTCEVLVAPGQYPNNARTNASPPGDFARVGGDGWCDGTAHTEDHSGDLASVNLGALEQRFPPGTDFHGPEPQPTIANGNGRPNAAPHSFTVQVLVHTQNGVPMTGEDRRAAYLHRDQWMLNGFPRKVTQGGPATGDGESSPAFADLDGDNRNELIYGSSDGYVHALERDGTEVPGWPVKGDVPGIVSAHTGAHAYTSGEVPSDNLGGAILGSVAVGDTNGDGVPEVYASDMEGKVYGWNPEGQRIFTEESNPAYSGKPLQPFENVRYSPGQAEFRRTQHGFIASPVLADLDGDGSQELIAAGMDRHVYAWHTADSDPAQPNGASQVSGFPVLVVDPSKVQSIDPQTHAVTFRADADSFQQGAIIDTPAVSNIAGDSRPEIVIGTNEEYDEPLNAGNFTTASFSGLGLIGSFSDALQVTSPGNSRLYALKPDGDADSDPNPSNAIVSGWPFRVGVAITELLPVVGEGITGYPVVAPLTCPSGGSGPKVGVLANNGPAYVLNANGTSCYGNDPGSGKPNALESDFSAGSTQYDHPVLPAVGLPAFGDLGGAQASFLSPVAGVIRALDVALPEYQGGQDFISAWDTSTGQFRPAYPATVNDLQFLTGPSIADIDGTPGEEVLEGTASMDLAAYTLAGTPAQGFPKLSTDWTVANPLVGSFGTRDSDPGTDKVIVAETRSGYINAYTTVSPACSPSSWPRFHHDNANSGDTRRDATLPGKPFAADVTKAEVSFKAPGDDLLCRRADRYQVVTSGNPIGPSNFGAADALSRAPSPSAPGGTQTYKVPEAAKRYLAIRAVDNRGNVGRPLVVDLRGAPRGPGPGPGPGPGHCSNAINGTRKGETLNGTAASDRIRGRGGADRIGGRRGNDCLAGGRGKDRVRGDTGNDSIKGGRGKDRLGGKAGKDSINGGGGKDRVRGNAGGDSIKGGRGRDRVAAGSGGDKVRVRGGGVDRVKCGPGRDVVFADRRDRVARNCERVKRG